MDAHLYFKLLEEDIGLEKVHGFINNVIVVS